MSNEKESNLLDEWGYFVAMPESVIEMWPEIGVNAIGLFLYLRYRTNKKRGCAFPSMKKIKEDTQWSYNRIQKTVEQLEERGLLERKKRFGKSTEYILKKPPHLGAIDEEAPSIAETAILYDKPDSIRETQILGDHPSSIRETQTSVLEKRRKVLKTQFTKTQLKTRERRKKQRNVRARKPSKKDQVRSSLEENFSRITNIQMPKRDTLKQKKSAGELWWAPLREMAELCEWDKYAAISEMKGTIEQMREDDLTISSPKSILNVFRARIAEAKSGPGENRFMSREYR